MNNEVEVANVSSNDSTDSSVHFTVLTNSHLSVEIHCLEVMCSIALFVDTSASSLYSPCWALASSSVP
jgi:hypothetical protein